jgi:CBS domain-containing protein
VSNGPQHTDLKPVILLQDLMSTRVAATTPSTPLAQAAASMVEANVGSAVVMQGRFLVGILTERDVLRAAASGQDLSASSVSEWVSPDTPTEDAAQIMLLHGFRHLPIVDGRTVCGVVSLRDLFASRIRRPRES